MLERDSENEASKTDWVPLQEIPPLDYFFGSTYKGAYWHQMEADLKGIEEICRFGKLPPIVLSNDHWDPPATHEPVMVAPGLSALQKVSLTPKSEDHVVGKNIRLAPTTETYHHDNWSAPIGWTIHINDKRILHSIEHNHPERTKEQICRKFLASFNVHLKAALIGVSIADLYPGRFLDRKDQNVSLFYRGFFFQMQPILMSIALTHEATSIVRSAITLLIPPGLQIAEKAIEVHGTRIGKRLRNEDQTEKDHWLTSKEVSCDWRRAFYYERDTKEPVESGLLRKYPLMALPLSMIFEDVYTTADAVLQHRTPLVRFRPTTE